MKNNNNGGEVTQTEKTLVELRELLLRRDPSLSKGDAEVLAVRVALGALEANEPGLKLDRDELRDVLDRALAN